MKCGTLLRGGTLPMGAEPYDEMRNPITGAEPYHGARNPITGRGTLSWGAEPYHGARNPIMGCSTLSWGFDYQELDPSDCL